MFQLASVVSYHCAPVRRAWLHVLCIFLSGSCRQQWGFPWAFIFPSCEQTEFSQPLLVCHVPLTEVLCWTHSRMSVPFFYWEAPNWTHLSRICLTSDIQRERITSLGLCWITLTDTAQHSTSHPPGTAPPHLLFSRKSLFPHSRPLYTLHWIILTQMQNSVNAFVEFHEVQVRPFLRLS